MGFSFDAGGLSRHQAAALAAVMACKPCCAGDGEGSGSGSGSDGGGIIIPCCDVIFDPDVISWEVTGVTCGDVDCLTGTRSGLDIQNPACVGISENMPDGWQLREGDPTPVGFAITCEEGDIRTTTGIDLCCIELIADPTQSQLWVDLSFTFSDLALTWLRVFHLLTNSWDLGSCEAGVLEIINRPITLTDSLGVTTCAFPDPRVSVIFT
jgi:hypothetical protein